MGRVRALFLLLSVVVVVLLVGVASAGGPTDWKKRRIYQILTDRFARDTYDPQWECTMEQYCGGTFAGAAQYLDYVKGMGFNAIWISPVVVNTAGGYHGYWAKDFFQINPYFGTAQKLAAFVAAAHAKDVWIMIDVVVNHVGPIGTNYTEIHPFNTSDNYHRNCEVNEYTCGTETVYDCRLDTLPDLNQSVPFVRNTLFTYVAWLLKTFDFDGIRADTVMYIKNDFWSSLQQSPGLNGTYIVGEVYSDFACNLNYTRDGIDATLNYPLFYGLRETFQTPSSSMRTLGWRWRQMQQYPDPDAEVNFLENHDNSRFLNASTATVALYRSALAHMYFTNGIPCIYYGTEQLYAGGIDGNWCRAPLWWSRYDRSAPMYQFLGALSRAHQHFQVWDHTVGERWQDDEVYCYVRGPLLVCTTNQLNAQTRTLDYLPFAEGEPVCNWLMLLAPCLVGNSSMSITIPAGGEPLVLYGAAATTTDS